MNCEKYLSALDDLVEGELDRQTAAQLNLHIFACPPCASEFEMLKREKETYARYLFDAEPSSDLLAKFQTKLRAETQNTLRAAEASRQISARTADFIRFWSFSPVRAIALLIILFGIGLVLLKIAPSKPGVEQQSVAGVNSEFVQPNAAYFDELDKAELKNSPLPSASAGNFSVPKKEKNNGRNKISESKKILSANVEYVSVNAANKEKKSIFAVKKEQFPNVAQLSGEERLRTMQAVILEKEITRQIEKVELLLRSFRNARSLEDGKLFDVAYEKQQARKLLGKNVELRQNAEDYGTFYTEEILGKVEPLLLDIANLESNPSSEKVLDIKERVKNQNIIASLQVYK